MAGGPSATLHPGKPAAESLPTQHTSRSNAGARSVTARQLTIMSRMTNGPDYERLKQIDWTFRDAYTRGGPHGIHPYPAKFIPQIPQALIAALHPGDDTAVLDPF